MVLFTPNVVMKSTTQKRNSVIMKGKKSTIDAVVLTTIYRYLVLARMALFTKNVAMESTTQKRNSVHGKIKKSTINAMGESSI